MSAEYERRWAEFLRAKAEAHRLQAEQYAAEERAYVLNPIFTPNPQHIEHLREMQASYRQMAADALAEIEATTTAQEGTTP